MKLLMQACVVPVLDRQPGPGMLCHVEAVDMDAVVDLTCHLNADRIRWSVMP